MDCLRPTNALVLGREVVMVTPAQVRMMPGRICKLRWVSLAAGLVLLAPKKKKTSRKIFSPNLENDPISEWAGLLHEKIPELARKEPGKIVF